MEESGRVEKRTRKGRRVGRRDQRGWQRGQSAGTRRRVGGLSHLCSSDGKESTCNAGDLDSILGLGRTTGEGKGHPLQYSGLETSRDRVAHGVAKSRTQSSDFPFHFVNDSVGLRPHHGSEESQGRW